MKDKATSGSTNSCKKVALDDKATDKALVRVKVTATEKAAPVTVGSDEAPAQPQAFWGKRATNSMQVT